MTEKPFVTVAELLGPWGESLASGKGPEIYPHSFPVPEVCPGSIVLLGGAPGAGKTAFVMNLVVEMLRFTDTLRVLVANVEMAPETLLDRQLARLSGIDAETIRHRRFTDAHKERLAVAMETMGTFAPRLAFLNPPFTLENVAASADEFGAAVIVLDYVQRIRLGSDDSEARVGMNRVMDALRRFAGAGIAVIVLSAVGRSKDSKGRVSYAGEDLSLGSFRESSELEFGADDAFILAPATAKHANPMMLKHLKCRNGALRDCKMVFDRAHQSFELVENRGPAVPSVGLPAEVLARFARATPASNAPRGESP